MSSPLTRSKRARRRKRNFVAKRLWESRVFSQKIIPDKRTKLASKTMEKEIRDSIHEKT